MNFGSFFKWLFFGGLMLHFLHTIYEEQLQNVNEIAVPMASKKLVKRVYKSIKHAKSEKNVLRRGLKEVTKAMKKKEKGFVVLAGDVRPVEIYGR